MSADGLTYSIFLTFVVGMGGLLGFLCLVSWLLRQIEAKLKLTSTRRG